MIATLLACLPCFEYDCNTVITFFTFWAWLPHCWHVCHVLSIIATIWPCFDYDCHTTVWQYLSHSKHDCHTVGMFATFWELLPHFDYDCHTVVFAKYWLSFSHCFATFWLWLPHNGVKFNCKECEKIFSNKYLLKSHVNSIHRGAINVKGNFLLSITSTAM